MLPLARKALLRVGLFYGYGMLGAFLFTLVEKKDESNYLKMTRILSDLKKEVKDKYNMSGDDFDILVNRAVDAVATGDELDWTFLNSCGFMFAAITTIGYGHITPKTELGQGLTVVFCLFGLPITMLAFKTAGQLIATGIRFIVLQTETKLLKREQCKHIKIKTFLVAVAVIILLLILASVSTIYTEKWSFMESFYTWFTTFTTIGFGDFVQFRSMQVKIDHGETSTSSLIGYGVLYLLPYLAGLCLMSCILTCLVESVDHIRNYHETFCNWCMNGCSLFWRLLHKSKNYDVNNINAFGISREESQL